MILFCQVTDPHLLWQNDCESVAEDVLHSGHLELSSNNLYFDHNIFDEAVFELNSEMESLSGKSIKDFGFTLQLNLNLNQQSMQSIYEKQTITIPDFLEGVQTAHSTFKLPLKYLVLTSQAFVIFQNKVMLEN